MLEAVLEKQHLKEVSIHGKKIYIVDNHQYALLIWASHAIPKRKAYTLVSIDYHPDTNPPFWLHAYQKAMAIDPEREEALVSIFQKRVFETINPAELSSLEEKMMIMRNDEHINTAMTLGYLCDYHMINCMAAHQYTTGKHYLVEEKQAGSLNDTVILETGFNLESSFPKKQAFILDIDLDYFRYRKNLLYEPNNMAIFKKLVLEAEFLTVARSFEYFEYLKKENFSLEDCEDQFLKLLSQILNDTHLNPS